MHAPPLMVVIWVPLYSSGAPRSEVLNRLAGSPRSATKPDALVFRGNSTTAKAMKTRMREGTLLVGPPRFVTLLPVVLLGRPIAKSEWPAAGRKLNLIGPM